MNAISEKISTYIQETFIGNTEEHLDADAPLLSSGIIDSISALELVDFLEQSFGLEFLPHEVDQENLNTVNLIEAFVLAKKAG
ncbi:acyl carrier protein [Lewinella cohaerens]|uniref:acyl carrier protein n=1 Tax=Lewinella cohaerens TaxID=70995 RepID=UPI00037C8742|nr:acyl carrier protein [Lewinella cohaerens]